jgi:hypothetical protein
MRQPQHLARQIQTGSSLKALATTNLMSLSQVLKGMTQWPLRRPFVLGRMEEADQKMIVMVWPASRQLLGVQKLQRGVKGECPRRLRPRSCQEAFRGQLRGP